MIGWVLKRTLLRTPVQNPLVEDTALNRYMEAYCRRFGCNDFSVRHWVGEQATCFRCGHRNSCALPSVPEWSLPDHCKRGKK